jgi:hypothetical protein
MRKACVTAGLGCILSIAALSLAEARVTGAPVAQIGKRISLACFIDNNHLLNVGNATPPAIPRGTPISFTAKLENAGSYSSTVPAPKDIPPHLFVTFTSLPVFDSAATCLAWRITMPVAKAP